jgi:hypothetical protein
MTHVYRIPCIHLADAEMQMWPKNLSLQFFELSKLHHLIRENIAVFIVDLSGMDL